MNSKIIGIVVVVLIVLAGGFFLMQSNSSKVAPIEEEKMTAETPSTAPTDAMMESASESGDTAMEGDVVEFTVTASNFKFAPTVMSVKKGDTVRITFKNTQGMHDFVLDDFDVKTKVIEGVGEEVVEFVANETGKFEYYCSVGSHRQMGMVGTLTVTP